MPTTTPTNTTTSTTIDAEGAERLPWRLVGAVMAGTLLNPLNTSMIAVAVLTLGAAFRVSTITAAWLISGFYLAGAIGMPLMGRLADQFGPRRVFSLGLLLVDLTSALAPLAPAFGWLLAIRIVQAFGTASAYPAGLAIIRARDRRGRAPAAALGAVSIAGSVSAALGPVLGGGLVALAGWPASSWSTSRSSSWGSSWPGAGCRPTRRPMRLPGGRRGHGGRPCTRWTCRVWR